MDLTAIAVGIVTAVTSIAGVALFLKTNMPKITPWVALAKDGVETVNDISQALTPDANGKVELTPEEIAKINADAIAFRTQLSILLGK